MLIKNLLSFIILDLVVNVTLACNGYKAKILKLENCAGDDAVILVDPEFAVKLNKKCELVPNGCINNKAFNTAVTKFKVQKDGIIIKEGKIDLCAVAEQASAEAKDILKLFGAPNSCPVKDEKICTSDHRVDLSKYRAMLGMARGRIIVDSDIEHDTGKSCFHAEIEMTKT